MTIPEIVMELENNVAWLRDLAAKVKVPVQPGVSIPDAIKKLRLVFGHDAHVSICPPEFDSYQGTELKVGEWGVYVAFGEAQKPTRLSGSSLEEAVNAVLAEHEPKPEQDASKVAADLAEQFAEPLPM